MSSFCHNLYDELKNDELHIKFHQIVNKENEILRDLAKKNDVEFVMNYEQVQDLNVMMVLDASSSILFADSENLVSYHNLGNPRTEP